MRSTRTAEMAAIRLLLHRLETPLGLALLVSDEEGVLRALDFSDYEARMRKLLHIHYRHADLQAAPLPTHLADPMARYCSAHSQRIRD